MSSFCQQGQLYAAENEVTRGREFATPEEAQRFVDELRDNPYWLRNFDRVARIDVFVHGADGDDKRSSVGVWDNVKMGGVVDMHAGHLCERILLHEVAHVVAAARYGSKSHDPWFARTYLELVSVFMGPEVYSSLYQSFEETGVDFYVASSTPAGIAL